MDIEVVTTDGVDRVLKVEGALRLGILPAGKAARPEHSPLWAVAAKPTQAAGKRTAA